MSFSAIDVKDHDKSQIKDISAQQSPISSQHNP